MASDFDRLFSQFRESPWKTDPNGVPQERFAGNGNVDSQGWLSDGSVTADVIQANAVIAGKIDADAVTAREILANTITAAEIAASTITSNEIAANTITAADIAANTITANEIAANTITASEIAADTITASEIAADSITTNELAANAVITENLLAGNVTSAKIELTISGKNFGANNGSDTTRGVFFDSDTGAGLYIDGTGKMHVGDSSVGQMGFGAGGITVSPDVLPGSDNLWNLGSSSLRWASLWAVDTTINSSDERLKQDIQDVPLGLEFVRSLRPVVYRWKDTVDTQAREAVSLDQEALEAELAPQMVLIEQARARTLAGEMSDDKAESIVADARENIARIKARFASPIQKAHLQRRPGRRIHAGLIAQEVKSALDAAGVDLALWKQAPDGEQALAYTELFAPIIRAIQEMAERLDRLEPLDDHR